MSLWTKRMSEVTFADVDAFCQAGYKEGPQLDYKRDFPTDLAKTAAALANTRGGLLLLGVEANATSNQPTWPCKGMPVAKGLSERIMQTCRDGIYPSLLPEISPVIGDPDNAGHVFIVVRIHESVYAPHSITNGTKVYVRTNDTNSPIELAHIDRIAMLLERRKELDRARELIIAGHIQRLETYFTPTDPLCWICCLPEFPHDPICSLDDCRIGVEIAGARRAPDGYLSTAKSGSGIADRTLSSAGRRGDLFYARSFRSGALATELPGEWIAKRLWAFLVHAQAFYNRSVVQHPGPLRIALSVANARNRKMAGFSGVDGEEFPDKSYRIDRTAAMEELTDEKNRQKLATEIITELFHAFDLAPPPPPQFWMIGALVPA